MRCSVRRQAALHSRLVMCVAGSQKRMQSSSVLPPPPGVLGALCPGVPGASTLAPRCEAAPPESTFGVTGGARGATFGAWGAGGAMAGGGARGEAASAGTGEPGGRGPPGVSDDPGAPGEVSAGGEGEEGAEGA